MSPEQRADQENTTKQKEYRDQILKRAKNHLGDRAFPVSAEVEIQPGTKANPNQRQGDQARPEPFDLTPQFKLRDNERPNHKSRKGVVESPQSQAI
tara:strand:- start:1418 stop:1705 length:288 start_codon:yes stop_codon:yes gene_type:complete